MMFAIVWPGSDVSNYRAFLVSGEREKFPLIFLRELQSFLSETLEMNLSIKNNKDLCCDILNFVLYGKKLPTEEDLEYISKKFEELVGICCETINDPQKLCRWYIAFHNPGKQYSL